MQSKFHNRCFNRSRWLILLMGVFLLAACATPQPLPVDPGDAQKMVFQAFTGNKSPATVASYTLLGSQAGFTGQIVVYWMCQPASPNSSAITISGYAVARKYWFNQGIRNFSQLSAGLPAAGALLEFPASSQDNQDGNGKMNIIYGRILSPEVQALEVEYTDQKNLRWPVSGKGFLLFRNEPVDWVRLNVLGEKDRVLKSYDLSQVEETLSERATGWGTKLPVKDNKKLAYPHPT